jgi:single-strand DNA-binding protein
MPSLNKTELLGRLGSDPEMRTFPDGGQVANVSIATTDGYKDRETGEWKEYTDWHRVAFRGRLAEIAGQYLRKGSQVYVEGPSRTRKWEDKDGVERFTTEVRVNKLLMLDPKHEGTKVPAGDAGAGGEFPEDDIPF